jgi:hypothetical protein
MKGFNMALINSRERKQRQTIQEGAHAAIEALLAKLEERIPTQGRIFPRRQLDVDAVLARSLRSVGGEEL